MEMLKKHEEIANSTSQAIYEMRRKFEEKMVVLKAENHSLKTQLIDQANPIKNVEKEIEVGVLQGREAVTNARDTEKQMLKNDEQENVQDQQEHSDHESSSKPSRRRTRIERKEHGNKTYKIPTTTSGKICPEFTYHGDE